MVECKSSTNFGWRPNKKLRNLRPYTERGEGRSIVNLHAHCKLCVMVVREKKSAVTECSRRGYKTNYNCSLHLHKLHTPRMHTHTPRTHKHTHTHTHTNTHTCTVHVSEVARKQHWLQALPKQRPSLLQP